MLPVWMLVFMFTVGGDTRFGGVPYATEAECYAGLAELKAHAPEGTELACYQKGRRA